MASVLSWTEVLTGLGYILGTMFCSYSRIVKNWYKLYKCLVLPEYENNLFSLKYYIGPVIGSGLYSLGGFLLPFVVVGSVGIVLAVCLFFAIPKGEYENREDQNESDAKKLTWAGVFKVLEDTY